MDRKGLIDSLNDALGDARYALDSRYFKTFTDALDKGVRDKFITTQERSDFSNLLIKQREKWYTTPLKDNQGNPFTKNVHQFNGQVVTKPVTYRDLLEYDKNPDGTNIAGSYHIPDGAIVPTYPNGQVGKPSPQNVGETLGKQGNLAKQFATQQQQAADLERTQGESALTPGKYAAIAAGGLYGMPGGLLSDAQAIARIKMGEDKQKVLNDLYAPTEASPTQDAFGFGAQSTRFIGQMAARGVIPAFAGMVAGGAVNAGTTAGSFNPVLGLGLGMGASIYGSQAAEHAQQEIFNWLLGDSKKQLVDPMTGKPAVDPVTGKPIFENSYTTTAGLMNEAGKDNMMGRIVGQALPNLVAGKAALPAIFDVPKIREIATLATAARQGEAAAIAQLEKMGVEDAAAQMAINLLPKLKPATGFAAKLAQAAESRPAVAFKNASQWLGEASGVTKAFSPMQQTLKLTAAAIKSHPEMSKFLSEYGESLAETGTEIQSAIQQYQDIEDYNARARALHKPEQEQTPLIENIANVLTGISFEGQHRLGEFGYRIGAEATNRALTGMGFDINPYTRAIAGEIKSTNPTPKITTLAPDEHIVSLGKGEFAVVNATTKTSKIVPVEEIDPRLFGMTSGQTATSGQNERLATAIGGLVPKAGFGKVPEFVPVGANKEIVQGITHDGYVIRRHLSPDNKADVRVVSLDKLEPANQTLAKKVFEAAGMKPNENTDYVESNAYTNEHHLGLKERSQQGQHAEAFAQAFPSTIALDNNIAVYGRIVGMAGKQHAVVQVPTQGRGTDMVVIPLQNIHSGTHAAKPVIDDAEVSAMTAHSDATVESIAHNPLTTDTNRITDPKLAGGKQPVMLTPEQQTKASAMRSALDTSHATNLSSGMNAKTAGSKRASNIKKKKAELMKDIFTGSEAYPVGSYIEHADASGKTVGAVVLDNTAHGPVVRPLNNGAPYIAQANTITSGEPLRPEISSAITGETPSPETPEGTETTTSTTPVTPTAETPNPSSRRKFKEGIEVGVTPEGTPEEEIASTQSPTDVMAATGVSSPQVKAIVEGAFKLSEKDGKQFAVIDTALEGHTITDLIAQKPRNKEELVQALTEFLKGSVYGDKKMSATDAKKAAVGIANFYDRMIFAQASRIMQMTQDRIAGHKTSRVANPSNAKTAEERAKNDWREHHTLDIPVLDHTQQLLDAQVKALTGQALTWSALNSDKTPESKQLAEKAVEVVINQLMTNYYDSSVPAIGKFTKIKHLNDNWEGLFASVEQDGRIAGQMLLGFTGRTVSTVVHEIGHALFDGMPADMQIDALKHMGMTPRTPSALNPSIIPTEAHEKFATALEATFLNAEHNVLGINLSGNRKDTVGYLDGIFDAVAPFMREVHGVVYGEDSKPGVGLTWRMPYKGREEYIFLWDNMPVIVKIDGKEVRCKIPYIHTKKPVSHLGPGRLKADDPKKFNVEIVEFDHPRRGETVEITNSQIAWIGGLTNGFNKRMASALTYWLSERATRANAERQYTGIGRYGGTTPAAISAGKAGAKIVPAAVAAEVGVTPTPTIVSTESSVSPTPAESTSVTGNRIGDNLAVDNVILPAPQQADKASFVERVGSNVERFTDPFMFDSDSFTAALGSLYDINRQNSSIARDKWKDYTVFTQRHKGNQRIIGVKHTKTNVEYLVNLTTGEVQSKKPGETAWTTMPVQSTYAVQKAGSATPQAVQSTIDNLLSRSRVPDFYKPQVKNMFQYIAQMHGVASKNIEDITPDWLPVARNGRMPTNILGVKRVLDETHNVDGKNVSFEPIETASGAESIINFDGRKIIIANVNGVKVPFYVSTGLAGKKLVQPRRWYPFWGIGSDGWINKATSLEIANHHGSQTLKSVADWLDNNLGDLADIDVKQYNDLPAGSKELESINRGMIAVPHEEASGNAKYSTAVNAYVNRINKAKGKAAPKPQAVVTPTSTPTPTPTPEESHVTPIEAAIVEETKPLTDDEKLQLARFDIGKKVTKEQRRQILRRVGDSYKDLNHQKEFAGMSRNGEEMYRYPYSAEHQHDSDITGKKIRYYVDIPAEMTEQLIGVRKDLRVHPSELFPEINPTKAVQMAQSTVYTETKATLNNAFTRGRITEAEFKLGNELLTRYSEDRLKPTDSRMSDILAKINNAELPNAERDKLAEAIRKNALEGIPDYLSEQVRNDFATGELATIYADRVMNDITQFQFPGVVVAAKARLRREAEAAKQNPTGKPKTEKIVDVTTPAGKDLLNAVGLRDLTQFDVDTAIAQLPPATAALLNDPLTSEAHKEAILRYGYANKLARDIARTSKDEEIASGNKRDRNYVQAHRKIAEYLDNVLMRSRHQVELAEQLDADGNIAALKEWAVKTPATADKPVVTLYNKKSKVEFNVNLDNGFITITNENGTEQADSNAFLTPDTQTGSIDYTTIGGRPASYQPYSMHWNDVRHRLNQSISIPIDKLPQPYSGVLHIARMLSGTQTDAGLVAPAAPKNILWKPLGTRAFNEPKSQPLFKLRQVDRNAAVGEPYKANVHNVKKTTAEAISKHDHDNHSMTLIDKSGIMRVKSEDEPTSAQEFRARVINENVDILKNQRATVLENLLKATQKRFGNITDDSKPYVYRVIAQANYIDEATGDYAVQYERDELGHIVLDEETKQPVVITDNDGKPVLDKRPVEKYVLSYVKMTPPGDNATVNMEGVDAYRPDGSSVDGLTRMEPAVKMSNGDYVFYNPVDPSPDGNGSTLHAQDIAVSSIIDSYQTLASKMLQKYTPIVKWDGNPLAGAQVWAKSIPKMEIEHQQLNGVPVATISMTAAKMKYNIDGVGATNRWQDKSITRFSDKTTPVSDEELISQVEANDKHYFQVEKQGNKFIYKMAVTNINTREVRVFTSEKAYATESEAKDAATQEYVVLRGQAYDIWHNIGAERIANDVTRLAELSRKDITAQMTPEERNEILNAQVIMRQYDWYRGVSKKIMQRYGSAGLAMADLVGGTSPQTPVDSNWTNAVQALQMMNRTATYERIVKKSSSDKAYCKVAYNNERAVQVYSIWRAISNRAGLLRGANADGSPTSDKQQATNHANRLPEYEKYIGAKGANTEAIKDASDAELRKLIGDEVVSKLETKIEDQYKRPMLEAVAKSVVDSTLWTKARGGSDPVASYTGWADVTQDWIPISYTQITPNANGDVVQKFENQYEKMDFTVLPRNVFSGNKFGPNTDNVLQGFFNSWLDIEGEGVAPKARNFSLNLVGLSSGATIDVWAARYVRRMYHEWHQDTPNFDKLDNDQKIFFARVPPSAESGVEGKYIGKSHYSVRFDADGEAHYVPPKYNRPNPADPTVSGEFGTGQEVMRRATEYINQATGGKLEMLPSDLQAIVWFAEKQLWMNNGWTNASGAGGSFEYQFAQDVLRYGQLDRFNVMMSGNGVRHLTPEQKERMMNIMRKTLFVSGDTTESSPVAHLSCLVSNSNGNQLDAGGQTQVDINLVAKRGSTPLKPYDPETDVHALILNKTPEEIRDILSGRQALDLPNGLLNEHANRRISLAYLDGTKVKIVGTGVFDGGQKIGQGGLTMYQMVKGNELTDSRPKVVPVGKEVLLKDTGDVDYNQLLHVKPEMFAGRAKYVNGTGETSLYPLREDTGKHRRIREHQAYNVNQLKNASADMLRITGGLDAVISRVVGEVDGSDDIVFDKDSNLRIGHEVYFKPALADERVDEDVKRMYNERFSQMMTRMENFFRENNTHVQFVVQQDPRNQYSAASLINGNVGILAVWCPEVEMRYLDYGAGIPDNMLTPQQKANNAKLADYMSGDADRIRQHEEAWNDVFTRFWESEFALPDNMTIPVFQNYMNHYDVNTIHREALSHDTAPSVGINDESTAWGLGIREKLRHSVQQLGIVVGDGRVVHEADTRVRAFDEVLARDSEAKLQSENPLRVALYKPRMSEPQEEFHMHCTSYSGSRLPGLNEVYDYAMDALIRNDEPRYEKAMARLSDRAAQEVTRVFKDMDGVQIDATRNTGIFFGDVEPSIDATIKIDSSKHTIDDVLARAAHMGLMFRQQNVFVTQDAGTHEIPGQYNSDLGYTTEHRATFKLSEPITFQQLKDIQKALDLSGANLSQDGTTLTTFTVSDYANRLEGEGLSHNEISHKWFKGISQIGDVLQAQGISAKVKQDVCRLWNTGSVFDGGFGGFTPYTDILDNLRRRNPKALVPAVTTDDYNRNVNEVKEDVEFALSMLKGKDIKLPDNMTFKRTPLSIETQMAIADNYDLLPINAVVKGPHYDPMVVKAYKSLVKELDKQWKWLNVKIDFMPSYKDANGEMVYVDSYNASSAAVIEDIRNNNHLYIYPTTIDTFGERGQDFSSHPLFQMSPHRTASGQPMRWNDVLRGVHDALAHSIYGASFGANGEEIAFATHAMLTEDPMAIWALASETRNQNSWVNFNKKFRRPDGSMMTEKEKGYLRDRPFAQQKAALIPIDALYTGIKHVDDRIDGLRELMATKHDGYNGSLQAQDVVPVPMTDGFKVQGNVLWKPLAYKPQDITKPGLYNAGDVSILAPDGYSIDPQAIDDVIDWIKNPPAHAKDHIQNLATRMYNRLISPYLGHIQRGDIPNPRPELGAEGYGILARGVAVQVSEAFKKKLGFDNDQTRDFRIEIEDTIQSNLEDFEKVGEWHYEEGEDFNRDYGNRIKDPVTGEYRNHHGELLPTEFFKDSPSIEYTPDGRIVMYHATLHGKAIGDTGKLVAGDDIAWNSGDENLGLGGTPERISLTYSKAYALDVIKMLTNYMRIAQMPAVQKNLDRALTDRVKEALNGGTDPVNARIRFKFTQIAYEYSTSMGVPYDEAYDKIKDLWETSDSVRQFVGNLAQLPFVDKNGSSKSIGYLAKQAVGYNKRMGDSLKGHDASDSSMKRSAYHDYIQYVHKVLGTPYSLIVGPSLQSLPKLDVDAIKPVVYAYAVDPNMYAEHTPYEQELRTYTTGIMEPTGDIFDATGDVISSVEDSFVPSRPLFKYRTPQTSGGKPLPMPAPAPPTPAVPKPASMSDRIWGVYDTVNDFCRLSVGGDASPIMIQNFMLANPIEDPKLFFNQFLIMTNAARPNLSLSVGGKTIINGKNYGREADVQLGNELRASAFYDDAKAHGLTLSAFEKDKALAELQKTNPSATMMDVDELGYNSDIAVSTKFLKHLPGQGQSERFFAMSKDYVKMTKYAQAMQHMVDIGYIQGTPGYQDAARDMAALINAVAGDIVFPTKKDGDEIFARMAKRLFFAPRWATSRFAIDPLGHGILRSFEWGRELLRANRLEDLNDRDIYSRAAHTRMYAKTWGLWSALGILYGLLYKNDAIKTSVSKGGTQIQIGDFKFKPPGGVDKTMAIISSVMGIFDSNDKKSNVEKVQRAVDNIKTLLMGQLAPGASALYETVTGRNLFGEPTREVYTPLQRHWESVTRPILAKAGLDVPMPKISNLMADKFIYMWAQDMMEAYETMKDRDEPYPELQSAAMGAAAFIGARVKYAPKELNWKYDAAKNRPAPGFENTIIGAEPYGNGDMGWDKLTR